MAKDYAKFVPSKSRKPKRKKRLAGILIAIFFLMFVCIASAYFFLVMKKNSDVAHRGIAIHEFISKVILVALHKNDSLIGATAKKIAKAAENSPPPVHFDFYSELPNMQLTLTETPDAPGPKNKKPSTHYQVGVKSRLAAAENPEGDSISTLVSKVAISASEAVPTPVAAPVIHPDELTGLIDEEVIQKAQYILQLGFFETQQAAKTLQEALVSVGFNPIIVKNSTGKHELYKVQQGPFPTLQMATLTKSRLQKRGVTSVIQKVS